MIQKLFEIISYIFTTCFIADFLQFIAGIPRISEQKNYYFEFVNTMRGH